MAASLFLSNAGPRALSVYYFVFAIVFIPCSVIFSGVIDRWPRRVTMLLLLGSYMAGMLILPAFLSLGIAWYYVMYVFASILGAINYSTYFILLSDYFSVTEAKRISGRITIALGSGTVCGASLIFMLTGFAGVRSVFLVSPLLIGAAMVHLAWLTKREQPLDEEESFEEGIIDALKVIPQLVRRYPIVPLMSGVLFFSVVIGCILEFQTYSIYSVAYQDEKHLMSFYGKITAIINVFGILIALLVTGPLIPRLGVPKMGMVAPAANFLTLLVLTLSSSLPAGILAHVNYLALENNLTAPVFSLIYNAVPRRFVGRVRVINEGVIYTLALAFGGILLLTVQRALSLSEIAMLCAPITVLCFLAQLAAGRQYVRSLVEMLRSGGVDLDEVNEGFKLPDDYIQDILTMLRSDDVSSVTLGLELALRSDVKIPVPDFERALPLVPRAIARSACAAFARTNPKIAEQQFRDLAESSLPLVRTLALEALVTRGFGVEPAILERFLEDENETVRTVAAVSLLVTRPELTPTVRSTLCTRLASIVGIDSALAALGVLRAFDCSTLPDVLKAVGSHACATARAEALSLAAKAGAVGDVILLNWGREAFTDADASVRAGAAAVLVRAVAENELAQIWQAAYSDPQPEVRRAAALAMGRRGGLALSILSGQLHDVTDDAISELMDGIGAAGAELADRIFFAFFSDTVFPLLKRNLSLVKQLPREPPEWRALHLAIANSNVCAVHTVLHGLDVLGYRRVVRLVRTSMEVGDPRTRANAVETLSTLSHRHYVIPLLPLLEASQQATPGSQPTLDSDEANTLLPPLLVDSDPFIRAGAIMAWHQKFGTLPRSIASSACPLIAETISALTGGTVNRTYQQESPMNRLLFLKSVPFFAEMTLAQLIAVDGVMTRESYLPGERIFAEGQPGDKTYIVVTGEVSVRKRVSEVQDRELARLTSGQLFGEMALFDGEARSASVVAVTDTELLALDRRRFNSLIHQLPDISIQVCKVLARRLRQANS